MTDQPRLTDAARAAIEAAGEPSTDPKPLANTGAEIVEILESLHASVEAVQYAHGYSPSPEDATLANAINVIICLMLEKQEMIRTVP